MEHERELSQLAEEFESCRRINKMNGENRMTDLMQLMKERHSVRQYEDRPLEDGVVSALEEEIKACNKESGLHIQLVKNEPKAFDSFMAHYGKFSGVTDYIAMIGKKGADLDEKCGYYGERLVLKAQELGLNTCWVAMTDGSVPGWFRKGTEAALLAPTAMNQQKFLFTLNGNKVSAKAGFGFYSKIDLGIVKYHFEIGAGKENFQWA